MAGGIECMSLNLALSLMGVPKAAVQAISCKLPVGVARLQSLVWHLGVLGDFRNTRDLDFRPLFVRRSNTRR